MDNKVPQENRRRFKRLRAYHLAKYRLLSEGEAEAKSVLVSVVDIGAGGVRLDTEEYLPAGSLIELKINFPNLPNPIVATAKVAWIRKKDKGRYYNVGAQFVDIDEPTRKIIDEQVRRVDEHVETINQEKKKKKINLLKILFGRDIL